MIVLGLLIFAFGVGVVPAPPHGPEHEHMSKFCYSCHNSLHCTWVEKCHPDQECGVQVRTEHHGTVVKSGCFHRDECEDPPLIGKRLEHGHHVQCMECCKTDRCNTHMCSSVLGQHAATTTHSVPVTHTTVRTTPEPTTVGHVDVVITEAPTTAAPIFIATDPKTTQQKTDEPVTATTAHVTNVNTDTVAPTKVISTNTDAAITDKPAQDCVDHEDHGFLCSSFDQFNFCTDPTSFAYSLADEKCRKHCGRCSNTGVDATTAFSTTTDTNTAIATDASFTRQA